MTELKVVCKYDELVEPTKLEPHPKNRNTHPQDQIDRLAKMIEYQGVRAPIIVSNLSGYMAKGHGTLLACKQAGFTLVPVVYQDFENADQEYAFLQGDNAIAEWAELDLSGINADMADLGPDFDVDMLGMRNFSVDPSENAPKTVENQNAPPQYIVAVKCANENQMAEIFEEFKERGFDCKLIT